MYGTNFDNKFSKRLTKKRIADSYRCTCCPPNKGENYGWRGKPDRRFAKESAPKLGHAEFNHYYDKFDNYMPKRKPKDKK